MKKLVNGTITNISVVRSADMIYSDEFQVTLTSTSGSGKQYTWEIGPAAFFSTSYDFLHISIDLDANVVDEGEYVMNLKNISTAEPALDTAYSRIQLIVQIVEDRRTSTTDSVEDIYNNAVVINR